MAITETATDSSTETLSAPPSPGATGFAVPAPAGIAGVVGSGDHKTLGRIWIAASGVFGVASFLLFAWYLLEATRDAGSQTDRAALNLSLAVIGVILGFAVPLLLGLATAVVPLQVGASTIAFPRAAAAALWGWLLSALLFAVSFLPAMGGGIGGDKVDGSVLTYLSLAGIVAALLLGTVCVMTTVITLRTTGLTLDRVPMFSWSMLVAGGLWLLTLPMLAVDAAFVIVDLKYGAPSLFGARDLQWTQLCWILLPPQVFAFAIPVLGILGDAVATYSKQQRQPQRGVVLGAIGIFGALSFGVYVQPAYDHFAFRQWVYIAQIVILVLPLLATVGGLATALRRGTKAVSGPLVLGLVSILLLILGALVAIPFVITPLDLQSTNAALMKAVPALRFTTAGPPVYTWGVFAIVIVAAAAGAAAGLFHWAPKITGRQMPDGLAKLLAPLFLVAALLFGGPLLALGFAVKATGMVDAAPVLFWLSLAGALLTAAAVAAPVGLTVITRIAVINGARPTGRDPWGGTSLEWLSDSPPAEGNFGELAPVTTPEPLLDLNDGGAS